LFPDKSRVKALEKVMKSPYKVIDIIDTIAELGSTVIHYAQVVSREMGFQGKE